MEKLIEVDETVPELPLKDIVSLRCSHWSGTGSDFDNLAGL